MEQAGVQLIAAGGDVYISTINNATKATNTFVDATDKGSGRVSAAGQVMIGGLRKVGEVAVDAFGKALKATAAFVGDSISVAGDFEQGMLDFQAVAGKDVDTDGLEEFRDLFIDIGKRLPVSTTEVQQAATEMVKGGIDPAIIAAGGLERNIQFAAAAMDGDLVKAAEISSKVLGGWTDANASAEQKTAFLTEATDLLSKAANASATDVEGLSQGIFNSQGIAKTAGVGFGDLTTTLALLAPRFASSSEAGNSLKNVIARLQPTTDPAASAMEGLGLYTEETGSAFYDATGNFVGFEKASQLLKESLIGLTKEQQAQALQIIFGNDAMGAAAALADGGSEAYRAMAEAMASANGVMDTAALKQAGFNTSMDNAQGSVEALQIQLGTHLLPILGDVLDNYITPGINAFSDWASAILEADDPIQALITSIDTMLPGFQSFLDTAQIVGAFLGDNLKPILFGIGAAIAVAVVPPLLTATGAFLAAAAPIVALVAAGALLYKAWETDFLGIKTTVTKVWNDTLLPAFKDMQAWLAEKIPPAIKTLSGFWTDTLQPALKVASSFLNDKVFPILGDLANVWLAVASVEVKALAVLWTTTLWPALKMVGDFIGGTVIPIFKALFEVNWAIATKAVEAMAGLWQKVLQPAFKTVSDYVTTTVVPALTSIGDYLSQTFGPALKGITDWLGKVTGGFNGVTGGVKGVVEWLGKLATSISTLKLPSWLTPGSPTPWEIALYGIGAALSKSVSPGLKDMRAGVQEIGAQISETFQDTDIIDMLTDIGKDAMAGFGKGLKSGLKGVISIVESTANSVEDAFNNAYKRDSPAKRMIPIGEDVTLGFMQGMAARIPDLMDLVADMADEVTDMVADLGSEINGIIADSFGATASIDRQLASNIGKMKDVLPDYQQYTEGALKVVEKEARAFLDPAEGAKYFKMRSNQIFEYAKLQKELSEAQGVEDKARIQQQMSLVASAHRAEISQFDANKAAQGNPYQSIIDQISALFAAGLPVNDTGLGHDLMLLLNRLLGIPGYAGGGPVERGQPYWVGEDGPELFWPQMSGMVSPAASSQQMAARANTTNYNTTYNNTMPMYTNNSPGALQQSWAIMQASMP